MSSSSLSGRRLAGYDVGPLLGAGGMGEVYRARDAKLNREVAIKILLPAVASDTDRLARFRREAQVLAALNHPNIAHIHGLEEADAGPFLVMELVDGPTLADRIAQGPIAIGEAIAIARQIADALEAAHERGIIHRDLKPANIKVSDDGAVKVLDFGLAKAIEPGTGSREPGADQANSPTITTPAMTGVGMILGTAAYMSPEQAKGRVIDRRSDVWAFGCVLYEMLTGRRAFDGEDVTDTIAAVVRADPDWSALPADTPPQIRLLLQRCLEKDRRARVADISVARFLMNETIAPDPSVAPAQAAAPGSRRVVIAAAVLGLVAGATVVALAAWMLRTPPAAARPATFAIVQPDDARLEIQGNDRDLAIAADGTHIVYRSRVDYRGAGIPFQLSVRALNHLEPRALPGTAGARFPFFSPDGRWIGYFASGELRKISIEGGPSILVCGFEGTARGASWGDDGTIVFATLGPKGLLRVSGDGGEPAPLFPIDGTDLTHRLPAVLPGSTAVLFTSGEGVSVQVHVADLATGQHKTLIRGSDAVYVDSGYLVFVAAPNETMTANRFRSGSLLAVRFDVKRLEVLSDPVPVSDEILTLITGAGQYSVSRNGTLVYLPPDVDRQDLRTRSLVWVNRKGQEEPLRAPDRAYASARISPDGSRVVVDIRDQGNDIWIWDLKRETLTPLNRDPAVDMSPQWTPDGRRIVWASTRVAGTPNLYWQLADGTGAVERLTSSPGNQFPTSITPDGSRALLFGSAGATVMDLFTVALNGPDRKAVPLLQLPSQDLGPEVSPDGRWLAYHSTESGEPQVFVRPFPNVDAGRWPISTTGGSRPAWSRDGRELFYLDDAGVLTSVAVQAKGDAFAASAPAKVLTNVYHAGSTTLGLALRAYDVSPDGQRFLMIKEVGPAGDEPARPLSRMIVVQNWFEELRARTAAR